MNKTLIGLINQSFQPTLPARGATRGRRGIPPRPRHFNPRSPHGERHISGQLCHRPLIISTHAPRTGSDLRPCRLSARVTEISTHAPRTGSDIKVGWVRRLWLQISTHAPRTGSDSAWVIVYRAGTHFNPRSPHGERLDSLADSSLQVAISTHAPRTGSDATMRRLSRGVPNFNPRSPHGERHNPQP